jgi:hypothetical protein
LGHPLRRYALDRLDSVDSLAGSSARSYVVDLLVAYACPLGVASFGSSAEYHARTAIAHAG